MKSAAKSEDMEESEEQAQTQNTEGCFDKSFAALTVDDVYEIAKAIGTDVEKIIDTCGKENVAGLVPKIVKVLELLESFASRNNAHKLREEELLKTFETIQLQQQRKRVGKESEEGNDKREIRVRDVGAFNPLKYFVDRTRASLATCMWYQRFGWSVS